MRNQCKTLAAFCFLSIGLCQIDFADEECRVVTDCSFAPISQRLSCDEVLTLVNRSAVVDQAVASRLSEVDARNLIGSLFCSCLASRCYSVLVTVVADALKGHDVIRSAHLELVRLALDRSANIRSRILATDLAVSASDESSIDWAIDLLDPRQRIPMQYLLPALEIMEKDPAVMARALPHLALVAQAGGNFHERVSAKIVLLRNKELLEPEILLPLVLVASEGCSRTADPVRQEALDSLGGRAGELSELFEEMCAWGNSYSSSLVEDLEK